VKDDTTYGLSPERLARLLAIGLQGRDGENNPYAGRTPAEIVREMLASKLPLDPDASDSLPAILNRACKDLLALSHRTISDLLLHPNTDLAVIKTLKDYGKELVRLRRRETEQAAATVIYYAAIGSALVFHGQKITDHSYPKLRKAYAKLEESPWIPDELKDLFRKARTVCREEEGRRE